MRERALWSQITRDEFDRMGGQITFRTTFDRNTGERMDYFKPSWHSITLPWVCDYMTMRMAAWIKSAIQRATDIDEPDSAKALLTNMFDENGNPQPIRLNGRTATFLWEDVRDEEMDMDDEVSVLLVEVDMGFVILTICKTTDDYYLVRAETENSVTYLKCDDMEGLWEMLVHFEDSGWPDDE